MIGHRDKVLPVQPFFAGPGDYMMRVAEFVTAFSPQPVSDLTEPGDVPVDEMSSPPAMLGLLTFLAVRAKSILEIGTFIGRTTIHLAQYAPVTTIETVERFAAIAAWNFRECGVADKITLRVGANVLGVLRTEFDLIYVDGGKQDYPNHAEACERLLSRNGAMVFDDVFFHGDALNAEPETEKGRGCKAVMERYRDNADFQSVLLPICNGVLLVTRR